jgi:hypothetical protein
MAIEGSGGRRIERMRGGVLWDGITVLEGEDESCSMWQSCEAPIWHPASVHYFLGLSGGGVSFRLIHIQHLLEGTRSNRQCISRSIVIKICISLVMLIALRFCNSAHLAPIISVLGQVRQFLYKFYLRSLCIVSSDRSNL